MSGRGNALTSQLSNDASLHRSYSGLCLCIDDTGDDGASDKA